ncbi:molybdopterin-binding protein [Haloprofundus sp. MHR1]|uniref:competence/damage-inducible protein A n=1 Tax=Haloprofundus sp. MHR1 TaxID=2572921 RepID=UPI0010BF3161|nr:molybdopterin-binding protein [Haloprofundus sp. MHR1]QCJ46202.1 competence/damage-inducible protein A [Haloprofundus sp. MHR1]
MDVAILTVGDELLAGDTENTNATWLARQLTERGATVTRILTVPDVESVIADAVRRWSDDYDAVVVTGGLGGTHDDLTMDGVAEAFGVSLVVDEEAREDILETVAAFREANPELAENYDLRIDADAQASIPDGARPLLNPAGLSPGCVMENVYVLPGIPDEMRAMFDRVADEFGGDVTSETLRTPAPEGAVTSQLAQVRDQYDVAVGSYPSRGEEYNRIKVTSQDPGAVDAAVTWLREHVGIVEE